METVEEHIAINSSADNIKLNVIEENNVQVEEANNVELEEANDVELVKAQIVEGVETNVCHKSNGVDCDKKTDDPQPQENCDISESNSVTINCDSSKNIGEPAANNENSILISMEESGAATTNVTDVIESIVEDVLESQQETEAIEATEVTEEVEITTETIIEPVEKEQCSESEIIAETIVEMNNSEIVATNDQVKFETEIFVEQNDNDVNENVMIDNQENDTTNNILSELGPNIELSEVLRSSDISENNNSTVRQEVFNKEELLDILEGNDIDEPVEDVLKKIDNKTIKAQIALQQLSRLQTKKKKNNTGKTKKVDKKSVNTEISKTASKNVPENKESSKNITENKEPSKNIPENKETPKNIPENKESSKNIPKNKESSKIIPKNKESSKDATESENLVDNKISKIKNIVNVLVMDWQDDEPNESSSTNVTTEILNTEQNQETPEKITHTEEITETASIDSTLSEDQSHKLSKSADESAPRRLSRVIKKKVIFDPDNPDTFTKGKSITKIKEVQVNKDPIPPKKLKTEESSNRSKSKSPLSKLQWKKPTPKNSKQCKRLSEVDKLLMDEGAVNMIYQLTPEAPKGRKNMRTKAEFIKKIQSSTPDGKEMKFRERKKESLKYEDVEAKHILGGRHRISLSGSVKSPSVSEDFETHSADDSIIYRRHSSSSYSSSCMSPRRLSDVDVGAKTASPSSHQVFTENQNQIGTKSSAETVEQTKDVFKTENIYSSEIINKDDCLSIKEKLNTKLSLALNKRKRESNKIEKPVKQKKMLKVEENITQTSTDQFKFISVNIDQRLAVISIKKMGLKICVEVLKELEEAFNYINSRADTSITLLDSKCGTLCSSLDLGLLLDENKQIRYTHAYQLAESIRSLLTTVWRHNKLVCSGVWGACAGVWLALVTLSDVALCADHATFSLSSAAPVPGAAVLSRTNMPQALVNNLVIFGRQLSASEALQGGLISRILFPSRFDEQVHSIAKDIAEQPLQAVLLNKKLISLKKSSEAKSFLSCLEAERDLLVDYWISAEGQELIRSTLDEA